MVELVVRLVVSLSVVVGLMLLLAKLSMRRFQGRGDSLVRVVHRQALSRSSSIAVVSVGSRVLVLGTTEQQVQLLTELDPSEVETVGGADLAVLPTASLPEQEAVLGPVQALAATQPAQPAQPAQPVPSVQPGRQGRHAAPGRHALATRSSYAADGALAGSLLSTQTWKQAFAAATGRQAVADAAAAAAATGSGAGDREAS